MVKVKIKVRLGHTCQYNLQKYMVILHEHLRYAGIVNIPQLGFQDKDVVEFTIDIPRKKAEQLISRIRSFGDYAEIEDS